MTSNDNTPLPAAPTPLTDEQKAAIHGRNQLVSFPGEDRAPAFEARPPWSDPNDEVTAVQYGGAWSVVTGHRLPLTAMALLTPGDPALPGYPSLDADVAAVRSGIHPSYEWSASS